MSDGHLAEVQAELDVEKRTRDEVKFLSVNTTGSPIKAEYVKFYLEKRFDNIIRSAKNHGLCDAK